jgi:large-conductance mechanosensitive channel
MGCGCNGNGESVGKTIVKLLLCTKTNQCFVKHLVEKILPVLFWLSVIGAFVVSFRLANIRTPFGESVFSVSVFIGTLVVVLIYVLIVFYIIYVLKTIKDKLTQSEESCGCDVGDKEVVSAVVSAPAEKSVAVAKPARKKPGPKKGSTRGRKKAAQ